VSCLGPVGSLSWHVHSDIVVSSCLPCRLLTPEEQEEYGVKIGLDYPEPIPASSFARPHGGNYIGGDPAGATASTPAPDSRKAGKKARKAQQQATATPSVN
jgi:hypothetical protein